MERSIFRAPAEPTPGIWDMHPFTPQDIANSGLSGAAGVDQAWLGDCVFEACAAAVATTATGQAAISLAIEQNADQSYAVTFPGRPQDPVPVGLSSLSAQTNVAPALGSLNSSLFLAWTAAVNGNLNVAQVNPGAGGLHPAGLPGRGERQQPGAGLLQRPALPGLDRSRQQPTQRELFGRQRCHLCGQGDGG